MIVFKTIGQDRAADCTVREGALGQYQVRGKQTVMGG